MQYSFSWEAFFFGLIILASGAAVVVFHRQIADNFSSGASSYERYRLYGLIGCVVGIIVMLNIHSLILSAIFNAFFGGLRD